MNPGPLTLRELCWMAEGRQRDEWNRTAHLLAMLYNAFRGKHQRAMEPLDFHPLVARKAERATLKQLQELGVFGAKR